MTEGTEGVNNICSCIHTTTNFCYFYYLPINTRTPNPSLFYWLSARVHGILLFTLKKRSYKLIHIHSWKPRKGFAADGDNWVIIFLPTSLSFWWNVMNVIYPSYPLSLMKPNNLPQKCQRVSIFQESTCGVKSVKDRPSSPQLLNWVAEHSSENNAHSGNWNDPPDKMDLNNFIFMSFWEQVPANFTNVVVALLWDFMHFISLQLNSIP